MTSAPDWQITRPDALGDDVQHQVRDLARAVERADQVAPLDEQADLSLGRARSGLTHIVIHDGSTLLGYAQVDQPDAGTAEPAVAEVLVGLAEPRNDIATALIDEVETAVGAATLLVWARGDRTPVRPALEAGGYRPVRTLVTMSRPLDGLAPPTPLPDDVRIRPFVPGQDDAAWLRVNARAFAGHPEQGRWTQADLDERLTQPWFDANGFLLLVDRDDTVLGFHWTKLHAPESAAEPPIAEVYVIGLDPTAQGRGLGRSLLLTGLAYLRGTGAETVILYTEADNHAAVHLYEATGFEIIRREVQYRR